MKKLIVVLMMMFTTTFAFAHGGGCRKDSLPGQCCHVDSRTGFIHCH